MSDGLGWVLGGLVGAGLGYALKKDKKCATATGAVVPSGTPPASLPAGEAISAAPRYLLADYSTSWWYLTGGHRPYPELAYSAPGVTGFYATFPIAAAAWLQAVKLIKPEGQEMALYRWSPETGWLPLYSRPTGSI